ncbi:hypothetical protein BpHYR1_045646 [Brachionus plicatilis]|uniref:Uncharacterized protein n=1 Tax=Brachionus plicatilis TaxID=10195 RepID=A0A3M7TD89_BRAPC|nr:hypothetical protein BpHYR1_045646 [Brachionus plicatilis]
MKRFKALKTKYFLLIWKKIKHRTFLYLIMLATFGLRKLQNNHNLPLAKISSFWVMVRVVKKFDSKFAANSRFILKDIYSWSVLLRSLKIFETFIYFSERLKGDHHLIFLLPKKKIYHNKSDIKRTKSQLPLKFSTILFEICIEVEETI